MSASWHDRIDKVAAARQRRDEVGPNGYATHLLAPIRLWGPPQILLLDLVYVGALVVLLVGRPGHFLDIDRIPNPIGGIIPAGVPWFGALGAVTLSIYGLFDHNKRWDTSYNYWHLLRPMVGAILAIVAYLIFIGLINATGHPTTATPGTMDVVPYLVLGFVVGFRESTFRLLLQRAIDIILGPGIPGQTPASVSVTADRRSLPRPTTSSPSPDVAISVANLGSVSQVIDSVTAVSIPPGVADCSVAELAGAAVPPSSHAVGTLAVTSGSDRSFRVAVTVAGSGFGSRTVTVEYV